MNYTVDDAALSAFLVYAARERCLDASERAAIRFGRPDESRTSIRKLREVNKKVLFRTTQCTRP